MFKNLLIAMDLSHASVCLLRCVGPLRTAGAESATLVHVMNVRSVGGLYISLKHLVEPLLEMKEKQLEEAGFRTHLEIPLGDPAYEINRVAKERDASLIVAGTHGESLTKEILLGSVAHRLLQIAEKPVLLIPITALEGEHWERKCDALCRDLFRHPLFATDFSEPAERAFHYLEHIAAHTHPPEATLFHAQDPGRILPHLAHRIDEFNRIDRERLDALEVRLREWGGAYGVQGGGVRPTGPPDRGEDPERELQHSRRRRPGAGVHGGGIPGTGGEPRGPSVHDPGPRRPGTSVKGCIRATNVCVVGRNENVRALNEGAVFPSGPLGGRFSLRAGPAFLPCEPQIGHSGRFRCRPPCRWG
jgi:nucleotide-binding universal stress UspA family protein